LKSELKIRMLDCSAAQTTILKNRWPNKKRFDPEVAGQAKTIIEDVKKRGDLALVDFTQKFDGVKLPNNQIKVDNENIRKAYRKVNKAQVSAIKFVKRRVETYQKRLLRQLSFQYEANGVNIQSCVAPIRRLGCYVPGREAAYPSSLVMTIAPAKVAGVPEIVVCSPPRSEGEIDPSILVAADICGVNEVYRVGGAQAVAAMAYGTETIKPVDKLVGPGNKYVVAAKILVSQDLPIDVPAGPSEIVVLADETSNPRTVALDMISQAEHMDGVAVLVTTSRKVSESVAKELQKAIKTIPNCEMVTQNLSKNGCMVVCRDIQEAVGFVNEFAPEHLEVLSNDGWNVAEQIKSAGLVLVGDYTPVAASDYCLGTVHVLPTEGFSHVYSGLSVFDFVKRFNIVECSKQGLLKARKTAKVMAEAEGLLNHSLAVEGRFTNA
jgi:histidinol dehydrogenase